MSVDDFLANRFAGNPRALGYWMGLWREYQASRLADPHFARQITSGDDGCFWSRTWEMVLYHHLRTLTSDISSAPAGPDFRVMIASTPVYIEAVTPDPSGLPAEWLSPTPGTAYSFPHEQILLRWTNALSTKRAQFDQWLKDGRIDERTPTVIAVNSCRLSRYPEETGITQWPFPCEAVFPIGPLAVQFDIETGKFGQPYQSARFSVTKRNGSSVPTDSFLNPAYAGVSAVLGCATCHSDGGSPPMVVVHNPLARNPLPPGLLGATTEYIARQVGDEFYVERYQALATT